MSAKYKFVEGGNPVLVFALFMCFAVLQRLAVVIVNVRMQEWLNQFHQTVRVRYKRYVTSV